jgi:hypothetical protein
MKPTQQVNFNFLCFRMKIIGLFVLIEKAKVLLVEVCRMSNHYLNVAFIFGDTLSIF